MVVKAEVIWWWCRECGHVWGEAQKSTPPEGTDGA